MAAPLSPRSPRSSVHTDDDHSERASSVGEEEPERFADNDAVPWAAAADASDVDLHHRVKIDTALIEFDKMATQGQPRRLTNAGVERRKVSFQMNPPSSLVRVLLWQPAPDADKYLALGGQHSCKALQELREEAEAAGERVPSWMRTVEARVLRHSVDLVTRLRLAGNHQAEQAEVQELSLSRTAGLLHLYRTRHPGCTPEETTVFAVQASGVQDRSATWEDLRRNFGVLEKVVVALSDQAEPSLAALEARESSSREKVTLNLLRPFGRLITSKGRDPGPPCCWTRR